jgi:hypothetical protein
MALRYGHVHPANIVADRIVYEKEEMAPSIIARISKLGAVLLETRGPESGV